MVLNSINGFVDKGQDKKGIQVDTNSWVLHYSVYAK